MNQTEGIEDSKKPKWGGRRFRRFSIVVLMAIILSMGSMAWTTWSMLDLFQVDVVVVERLGGISLIGLSAAVTMDIFWSATMIAEYRGQKLPVTWNLGQGEPRTFNALPLLGWIEVLFVAGLLGYHGSTVGGGAATFAAVLPIFTKVTWMLALDGLRDPYDLTDDEKAEIAAKKRLSRRTRAEAEATAEQHEAEAILKEREHEAAMAEERRKAAIEREKIQALIECEKLKREARFEEERAELEGGNQIKAMRQRLNAQLQIETMRTQTEITMERLDAEQDIRLRSPLGFNLVQGQVVSSSRAQLPKGDDSFEEEGSPDFIPDDLNLTEAERRKVDLAARFYRADAMGGGITKAAFARVNRTHAPRVTEATTSFPLEWFVEKGLATWMEQG